MTGALKLSISAAARRLGYDYLPSLIIPLSLVMSTATVVHKQLVLILVGTALTYIATIGKGLIIILKFKVFYWDFKKSIFSIDAMQN